MSKYLIVILFTILLAGCQKTISSKDDAHEWMKSNSYVLTSKKEVSGIALSVTYTPPQYQAFMQSKNQAEYDSLIRYYKDGLYFIMEIGPAKKKDGNDIMFYEVFSEEEYNQRFIDLNFNLASNIRLEAGNERFYPVLYAMENTYGLTGSRKINFVFSLDKEEGKKKEADKVQFVFEDIFFNTGINYFNFDLADLPEFPEVKY